MSHFCEKTALDIIPIGFINVFPDQGPGGYPGSNFGNQCGHGVYNINGVETKLLSQCDEIAVDIEKCQAAGKTILLSLGGATGDYKLNSDQSAVGFADFLWGAFGPVSDTWGDGPRPFKNSVVDGFDLNIEQGGDFGMTINHLSKV